MSESSEPSPPSPLQPSARVSHWDLTALQLGVAAAIWDLCRIGKIDAGYALAALVLLAVPGATSLSARVISGYLGARGRGGSEL